MVCLCRHEESWQPTSWKRHEDYSGWQTLSSLVLFSLLRVTWFLSLSYLDRRVVAHQLVSEVELTSRWERHREEGLPLQLLVAFVSNFLNSHCDFAIDAVLTYSCKRAFDRFLDLDRSLICWRFDSGEASSHIPHHQKPCLELGSTQQWNKRIFCILAGDDR